MEKGKMRKLIMILSLFLLIISSCVNSPVVLQSKSMSKGEAEKLALQEAIRVFKNFLSQNDVDSLRILPSQPTKQEMLNKIDQMYVLYSVQKNDDSWVVYVAVPDGGDPIEVDVISRDDIRLPKFEEILSGKK